MKSTILFLIIFICFKSYSQEIGGMCLIKNTSYLPDIKETSTLEMLKQVQILHAKSDMKDFCRRNLILRFLNSQKAAPSNCSTLPMPELEKLADKKLENGMATPWDRTLVSTKKSRLESIESWMYAYLDKDFDTYIVNQTVNDYWKKNSANINDFIANAKIIAFCTRESDIKFLSCTSALRFIKNQASPVGEYKLMTPKAWKLLYNTTKYDNGLEKVARKLKNEIKNSSTTKSENVWDDLVQSFMESGLSIAEAEEGAWSTLAVVSNGGANARSQMLEANSMKSKSITFIGAAMSVLDYIKQEKGFPLYSFPTNVVTDCDSSKPYHFWMAAYLARELVKEKIVEVEDAAAASFLAEKGYQLNRNLGLDMKKASLTSKILAGETYGPIHQVLRMDLAYAASGAVLGAKSANGFYKAKIDMDASMISLLQKSAPRTSQNTSNSTLSEINAWEKEFAPNAALDALLKK